MYSHTASKRNSIIHDLQSMSNTFTTDTPNFKIVTIPPENLQKYTNNQFEKRKLQQGKLRIRKYTDNQLADI